RSPRRLLDGGVRLIRARCRATAACSPRRLRDGGVRLIRARCRVTAAVTTRCSLDGGTCLIRSKRPTTSAVTPRRLLRSWRGATGARAIGLQLQAPPHALAPAEHAGWFA